MIYSLLNLIFKSDFHVWNKDPSPFLLSHVYNLWHLKNLQKQHCKTDVSHRLLLLLSCRCEILV